MSELTVQGQVDRLHDIMRHYPQVKMPTQHFLLDGIYVRQIFIPAGTAFVGRVHKKQHYFMVLKGSAAVTTESGPTILQAGMVLMSGPGTRRAGVTAEDCIFCSIHRTEATCLADIEEDLVEFDPTSRYGVGNEILPPLVEKLS